MRTIAFLLFPGLQPLDLAGPMDAFGVANHLLEADGRDPAYRFLTIAPTARPLVTENGLTILPDCDLADAADMDTLVIPGGEGSRASSEDPQLQQWLRERQPGLRRIATVCTGAYVPAAAGLLDGRRVATHWSFADDLARRYPALTVAPDALHVTDGPFHSSGGLTAGIDLILQLIEADLGEAMAARVARYLVVYLRRPGSQTQYSLPLAAQCRGQGRLAGLSDWILENLDQALTVDHLAAHVALSPRQFQRAFQAQFGDTPARHVRRLRLERAALLLASTGAPLKRLAAQTGFASADALGRAFVAHYELTPAAYRARFSTR